MKKYQYVEQGDNGEEMLFTVTEEEIIRDYWPNWYDRMCYKFGKEYVDQNHTKDDCIMDWVVVNWAWTV